MYFNLECSLDLIRYISSARNALEYRFDYSWMPFRSCLKYIEFNHIRNQRVCPVVCPPACIYVCLSSTSLSVSLSVCRSLTSPSMIWLSVYLSIYMSGRYRRACLSAANVSLASAYLSVCLFFCPSACGLPDSHYYRYAAIIICRVSRNSEFLKYLRISSDFLFY